MISAIPSIIRISIVMVVIGAVLTVILLINYYSLIIYERDKQIEYLRNRVNLLENENNELLDQVSRLEALIEDLNNTLKEKEANITILSSRILELEIQLNNMIYENNRLRSNISALLIQNKQLHNEISRLNRIIGLMEEIVLNETQGFRIDSYSSVQVSSFEAVYPGYLLINITVMQGDIYIKVYGEYNGFEYIYKYPLTGVLETGKSSIIIPVLPGNIVIQIINTGEEEAIINLVIKYIY